jgi:Rrf2 family protein
MFRISRRLDYGLQLMIALGATSENHPLPTAYLATNLNIPLPFLHQIGHTLMQAGFIKATPGPHGGLRLNQPAESISVLKIMETLEGPLSVDPCKENGSDSSNEAGCATKFVWDKLQETISAQLLGISLAKLVEQAKDQPFFAFVFEDKKAAPPTR